MSGSRTVVRSVAAASFVALCAAAPGVGQVINEFNASHTGTDDHEYVELKGAPATDYSALTVVQLEGDSGAGPGVVDTVYAVGSTDAEGYWTTGFLTNELGNDNMTLLLVSGWNGSLGQDLDTDDDGTLDATPWTTLLDGVGVEDELVAGLTYATPTLLPGADGDSFEYGGASRIPDGVDTDAAADWKRNDFSGAGLPGFSTGGLAATEAVNTPGAANRTTIAPGQGPILTEVVVDHVGADDHEYLEIYGETAGDYSGFAAIVLGGDAEVDPGVVAVYPVGTANGSGFWTTGFLSMELEQGTFTVLLVEGWSGAPGADLDADDDGALDTEPWATLHDGVAITDGDAGDHVYAAVLLAPGFDGLPGAPGGASRLPYGRDTDTASDWRRNDFDGAGLDGFAGTLTDDEARNTPGLPSAGTVAAYYAGVDATSGAALRQTLHTTIRDHVRHDYSAAWTDTWNVLELADEDPGDPSRILDVYRNQSLAKFGGGTGPYNREHTWPNSYGFPDDGRDNVPYTDCHHLFLSDVGYNSDRGNEAFGTCHAGCVERPIVTNNGFTATSGVYPGTSNWNTGLGATGIWETWIGRRGDVARALLYMDVRYEGGTHGVTGVAEPDLVLTDDTGLLATGPQATAHMARLSTLLQWHQDDPVSAEELWRNEAVALYQGNRNPFVDHPEWVACLFTGTGCAAAMPLFTDGFESGDTTAWSTTLP